MQAQRRPSFDTEESERLYEYVEQNAPVERDELEAELSMDPELIDQEVTMLIQEGYLEDWGGTLQLAIDYGHEVSYETDGMEVTIRPAAQSDLDGLVRVMREVTQEEAYLTAESVVELLDDEEVVLRNDKREFRMFFVATVDDRVVGWVHLRSPNFAKLRHTAELTMGVEKEYRGHGIGSRLMEHGLEWAEANGYEKVYQSLPATNQDAVRFLERHRWETEAIRKAHFKIGDEYVAEQQMAVMLRDPVLE
ncbi:GNAT family N-acetyltransferase [Salinigranum rubrum]|uniref:GNAT family N-acetyltransferase n=1 Tax=Salinigranum rubrum TaxID=755307 RepID=A0A2I8VJH4_9EURY|nr:GNAT family N-acetyltransferase [Salinigranum rubrum]AUV82082.1 GNAT family N-acetyltransferase [Salinigranum rubrum]